MPRVLLYASAGCLVAVIVICTRQLGNNGGEFGPQSKVSTAYSRSQLVTGSATVPGGMPDLPSIPNKAEYIRRAVNFAKAVGWDAGGEYEVKFVRGVFGLRFLEVQNDDYTVDFDEVTREIRVATSKSFHRQRHDLSIKISEPEAAKLAKQYLKAAGLSLDNAKLQGNKPVLYANNDCLWRVTFKRMYNGYPYSNDGALVTLNPSDGSLVGFGYHFKSPKPLSTDVKVDKAAAVECARTYMAEMGYGIGMPTFAELLIVQPDDYWEYIDTGDMAEPQDIAQLAWVLRFNAPWDVTEVWVDAENGNILGGSRSKSMPIKGSIRSPFASAVQVEYAPQVGRPLAMKIVKGDLCKAVVSQIPNLKRTDAVKCSFSARIKVDCGSRSYTYGYSPANHLLVLVEKSYKGKTYKANCAFKTMAEIEQLFSICAGV